MEKIFLSTLKKLFTLFFTLGAGRDILTFQNSNFSNQKILILDLSSKKSNFKPV